MLAASQIKVSMIDVLVKQTIDLRPCLRHHANVSRRLPDEIWPTIVSRITATVIANEERSFIFIGIHVVIVWLYAWLVDYLDMIIDRVMHYP